MELKEQVQVLNMVRIRRRDGAVLVLDKVKKQGWEGLTFPGGKVEPGESFLASARREALEETGLRLGKLSLDGFVHWIHPKIGLHQVGLLYTCQDFSGQVQASAEGDLFWEDYQAFLQEPVKSDSMEEILAVYAGRYQEVLITIVDGKMAQVEYVPSQDETEEKREGGSDGSL